MIRADARVDGARTDGKMHDSESARSAGDEADEADPIVAARIAESICKRPRCCITRVMPAGVGGDGTRYTVVRVDLRPGRRRCGEPQTAGQEDLIDAAAIKANEDGNNDDEVCERYRWDLVAETAGKGGQPLKVRWRQPLEIDDWCISAFGVGGGEDEMSADPAARTVTHSRRFGSAWRGDERATVGLDPLRVVETTHRSWYMVHDDEDDTEWNWDKFSGRQSSSTVFCRTGPNPDASFPDAAAGAPHGETDQPMAASDAVIIPKVTLPAAFVKSGWSGTSFQSCAAHVDGKDDGFTIHGPARGDSADSELWAVMSSEDVLFVDVTDDQLITAAKSWVKADHLELWRAVGTPISSGGSGCFQPDPNAKALQWGIGLDGQVYKAHGQPASSPTVRVARTDRGVRFRIVLASEGDGLTVVYSDSDDGVRQKRLIATSQLRFGRPWTIGSVSVIGKQRATCIVAGGALRPKVAPLGRSPGLLFRNLPAD